MQSAGEYLITKLAQLMNEMYPNIDIAHLKTKISEITADYEIKKIEVKDAHPDLTEKIGIFLAGKQLEGLSKVTLKDYRLQLNMFSRHISKAVEDITTADIRVYLGKFEHRKLSTIATKLSVLKSFFSWLTAEEIILRDPTSKIKPPKKEKRLPKALTIEELEMLREACKTYRQRALIEVLYSTGCRLSEIHNLNRDDINLQKGSARVIGKGNKEREVFFSFRALYHLKKYIFNRLDSEPALFITERQPYRRVSRRGIQREVNKLAEVAGINKQVSPHVLRHTFATLTLNNGAELAAVQALLGHEDPATTQIYAQISNERKKEQHKRYLVQ